MIPNILNVLLIAFLMFLIFAIMAVNFFKGLFYFCNTSALTFPTSGGKMPFQDRWDCLNSGADFTSYDSNFDSIFNSLEAIFLVSQAFNWHKLMFDSTRIRGVDLIPKYDSSPLNALFFIIFMILSNFFITNLFVGVLVSQFNREKEKLGRKYLLTEE